MLLISGHGVRELDPFFASETWMMLGPLEEMMMIQAIRLIVYIVCNKNVEPLAMHEHIIIHTGVNLLYCNLIDMNVCSHFRMYTGDKPDQYYLCCLIIYDIIIHTSEKIVNCSKCAVHICSCNIIHTCEKSNKYIVCIAYFCNHILYIWKVLVLILMNVISYWYVVLRNVSEFLVNHCINVFNLHSLVLIIYSGTKYLCLVKTQLRFKHDSYTSHTKIYIVVCFGSGDTVSIFFTVISLLLSCSHHNEYQSNRMGLLCIVNHTPVRFSTNVTNNVIRLFLEYHICVYVTLSSINMPFSCTLCRFSKSYIYHRNNILWKDDEIFIILCYSDLCISFSKNGSFTLYLCHGRRG